MHARTHARTHACMHVRVYMNDQFANKSPFNFCDFPAGRLLLDASLPLCSAAAAGDAAGLPS